jgi:ABC-type transport system involved in multi-copper enzyme maturation permease subunit
MRLLYADLYKITRHVLFRWLVVGLLALVVLRGVVWPPAPDVLWTGLWSVHLIAGALIILTAITTGMEFSEDTFRSLVSRGVPRWALLLSKFVALILIGGLLLVAIEGLSTLLGIRPELRGGDLGRAWLSLWPYVALIVLLTVLGHNGGLALVVGVLWLVLEQFIALLIGPFTVLVESDISGLRFMTTEGFLGQLYPWTLAYNGANWTYLAEWQRTPTPMNLLLWHIPHSVLYSAVVLAGFTVLGLGLSLLIVYRRDVTEVVEGKKGLFGFIQRRPRRARSRRERRRDTLPMGTGQGSILVRLGRVHLFKMGRTSLVKIGLFVSLLFPLILWRVSVAIKATGFEDFLFSPGPEGSAPLAFVVSLLVVGPLATVLGILAVSSELSLGTRRAELTRSVTRLQAIVAQSLALMLTLGIMFAFVMAITLVIGASVAGTWALGSAAVATLVAMLATGVYVGAIQIGGALTRSPLGVMLFGLGFMVADWLAILAPTLMIEDPGSLMDLGRYAPFANTFVLANGGKIVGVGIEWPSLGVPAAALVLVGYIVVTHAVAVLIARWRDA